jgi:ABC-type branched-subunit amino acid transport system ATPase component/ABC-type branched-subunit amino acid transport system permease subunit
VRAKRLPEITVGAAAVGALACALAAGTMFAGDYMLYVLALVVVQGIAILSLNLLMGEAGQVSLGHAAFVGMGAYAAAEAARAGLPFPLTIVVAALFSSLVATIVGLPSLRIKGLQVAATTLAFGVTAEHLLFVRPWEHGSGTSIAIARPAFLAGGRAFLLATVLGLLVVIGVDRAVRASKIGRAFNAIRDREDTAAARGISIGATKLLAYAISGACAGIAGGLFAYLLERVTPDTFTVWNSLGYLAAVVVGGLGSWTGALVAGVTFAGMPELLRPAAGYAPLAGAIMLALVPVVRPEGLSWLFSRRIVGRRARALAVAAPVPPPLRALSLSMPVRTLLRAQDVAVAFGGVQALRGVSMEVQRGEIVGLIGPNGAGKSTFFNCISGVVRPDSGSIAYRGRELLALPVHARPSLGIARTFQNVGLSPSRSVRDNVLIAQHDLAQYGSVSALVRAPSAMRAERELSLRADRALDLTGMAGVADVRVADLSHGSQRRAEVAAAVASAPDLLLLDEPFAGMSDEESDELAAALTSLRGELGITMVVIEHDVPLVSRLCSYVYVLDEGAVLSQGTPAQVQSDPEVIAIYIGESLAHAVEVAHG